MKRFLVKGILFSLAVGVIQVALTLEYVPVTPTRPGDGFIADLLGIDVRIPDPRRYDPHPDVVESQRFQELHPTLGYLWKKNLSAESPTVLHWAGNAFTAYSDEVGFVNVPEMIRMKQAGRAIDVVGVGASFMQGATVPFFEYFQSQDLFYYNRGNHRFTLPQFNRVLEQYALTLKPRWVVYGLNESAPLLIEEFEDWLASGIDWFTYHSGTWCGPPVRRDVLEPLLGPGSIPGRLLMAVVAKLERPAYVTEELPSGAVDDTLRYVRQAHDIVRRSGAGFIVLLIPNKRTYQRSASAGPSFFDRLLPDLKGLGIPVIDVRDVYTGTDPLGTYFQDDGHWNKAGMHAAAGQIAAHIARAERQ